MAKQTQPIRRQIADKLFECLTSSQTIWQVEQKTTFWLDSKFSKEQYGNTPTKVDKQYLLFY